eukprot:1158402-Pelagomonas_calceolata.AAC.10
MPASAVNSLPPCSLSTPCSVCPFSEDVLALINKKNLKDELASLSTQRKSHACHPLSTQCKSPARPPLSTQCKHPVQSPARPPLSTQRKSPVRPPLSTQCKSHAFPPLSTQQNVLCTVSEHAAPKKSTITAAPFYRAASQHRVSCTPPYSAESLLHALSAQQSCIPQCAQLSVCPGLTYR